MRSSLNGHPNALRAFEQIKSMKRVLAAFLSEYDFMRHEQVNS